MKVLNMIVLLTLFSLAGFSQTETNGTFTSVYDVDTPRFRRDSDGKVISLRPFHMDGDELENVGVGISKTQPFAVAGKDSMTRLLVGKRGFVRTFGKSYTRYQAFVWLADGTRLDSLSIAKGWCGYLPIPQDTPASITQFRLSGGEALEANARRNKLGRYGTGKRVFKGKTWRDNHKS